MWGERHEEYQQVYGGQYEPEHEGKFSHEVVAGGAAFEAMHLFEKRQREEGKTVSHGFAKELLAGIAGGEIDKLFETKGLDYLDREKAKRNAENQARDMYDQHYGQYDQYNPNQQQPHEVFNQYIQRY